MFQIHEQPRGKALVAVVHEHPALLQQWRKTLQHQVKRGIKKRVSGGQQFGLGFSDDQRFVKGDASIAIEHWVAAANQPIPVFQRGRDAQDLEATLLALGNAATQQLERLAEEGTDEVGLQPASLGALHLLADGRDGVGVHAFRGQFPLCHQAFDSADVNRIVADYIRARGFEVPVFGSFNEQDDGIVASITPASVKRGVETILSHAPVDAVFVSCTSVRLAEAAREIEAETGVPITSSNHAMAWHALRLAGVDDAMPQWGRLFAAPLA